MVRKVQKGTVTIPCEHEDCHGQVHLIVSSADASGKTIDAPRLVDPNADIWDFPCDTCKRYNRVQFVQ